MPINHFVGINKMVARCVAADLTSSFGFASD
jgi:hypothetical protein